MNRHEQRLVRFLSKPQSYPHFASPVLHRETHVSHVFLAGRFAYKLKKPVRFPFLDASRLSLRRKFCEWELTLNRRLAPDVYLGLIPVIEADKGLRLDGHERGRVVEWLVHMRRLPEDRMLDQLVAKRAVSRCDMEQVADRLIAFFKRAERSPRISRYGRPQSVGQLLLGNLRECEPFVGHLLSSADSQRLQSAYRQALTLYEAVLCRRVDEGRIVDGHGDLRCENICLNRAGNPAIFDCVEFQPAFRCGDIANDLGFLIMDLEFRNRKDLADILLERYRQKVHDPTFERVLPIYECHRSLVRAKVRGLAWLQHPRTLKGRRMRELAYRHFQLAVEYAKRFSPPRLIVVGGLIGTGKSTLAKQLSADLAAIGLRTDEIRLREFAKERRADQGFADGLYAPHVSELVYHRLIQRAEAWVRKGHSVVCDGTFSKASAREVLRQIAQRYGASFHFFECVVPRALAIHRVARRYAQKADLSEARPTHYDRLQAGFEPVRQLSSKDWTRLMTDRSASAVHQTAIEALRRSWIARDDG